MILRATMRSTNLNDAFQGKQTKDRSVVGKDVLIKFFFCKGFFLQEAP